VEALTCSGGADTLLLVCWPSKPNSFSTAVGWLAVTVSTCCAMTGAGWRVWPTTPSRVGSVTRAFTGVRVLVVTLATGWRTGR
jgi:hypothetical protein